MEQKWDGWLVKTTYRITGINSKFYYLYNKFDNYNL